MIDKSWKFLDNHLESLTRFTKDGHPPYPLIVMFETVAGACNDDVLFVGRMAGKQLRDSQKVAAAKYWEAQAKLAPKSVDAALVKTLNEDSAKKSKDKMNVARAKAKANAATLAAANTFVFD